MYQHLRYGRYLFNQVVLKATKLLRLDGLAKCSYARVNILKFSIFLSFKGLYPAYLENVPQLLLELVVFSENLQSKFHLK